MSHCHLAFCSHGGHPTQTWIGVHPQHLAAGSQFGWLSRKCQSAVGLWTEGVSVTTAQSADKRGAAARSTWQDVTTARALGKWEGLCFAELHHDVLTKAMSGASTNKKEGDSNGVTHVATEVAAAASHIADCVLIDCGPDVPFRDHLAALRQLRQALLAVIPAPKQESDLRDAVGAIAGAVDGLVIRRPVDMPEAELTAYYTNLNSTSLATRRALIT